MDDGQRKEVMNVEEASRFLGVNPWTLRAEARLGRIPAGGGSERNGDFLGLHYLIG